MFATISPALSNSSEPAPFQESSTLGSPFQPLLGVADDSGTRGIALIAQRATNRGEQGRRLAAKAVKKDHYSVLGVTPASEDVVIRAAYHALMRRYHPDADPTAGRPPNVRGPSTKPMRSFATRRSGLATTSPRIRDLKFEPGAHSAPPTPLRSRLAPAAAIGVALLAMGMVVFAISPSDRPDAGVEAAVACRTSCREARRSRCRPKPRQPPGAANGQLLC